MGLITQNRPAYVPRTNPLQVGGQGTGMFELRDKGWVFEEATVSGTTHFVVDRSSTNVPTSDEPKWQFRILRVLKDEPSRHDEALYYRLAFVELVNPINTKDASKTQRTERPKKQLTFKSSAIEVKPKNRTMGSIVFMKMPTGDYTFSFGRHDGVIELLVLEPGQYTGSGIKTRGQTFTPPLDIEVVRTIDDDPKFKKFSVRINHKVTRTEQVNEPSSESQVLAVVA